MGVVWEKCHLQAGHYRAGDESGEAIMEGRKESENCLLFLGFPLFNYISVFIKVSSGLWTMFCASRHNYLIQLPPEGNLHSITTHLQWTKYKKNDLFSLPSSKFWAAAYIPLSIILSSVQPSTVINIYFNKSLKCLLYMILLCAVLWASYESVNNKLLFKSLNYWDMNWKLAFPKVAEFVVLEKERVWDQHLEHRQNFQDE